MGKTTHSKLISKTNKNKQNEKELKKAIIDFIFEKEKFQLHNATIEKFRLYIYDSNGNYLIGEKTWLTSLVWQLSYCSQFIYKSKPKIMQNNTAKSATD